MSDLVPGYEHVILGDNCGGFNLQSAGMKHLLHTTESPFGSIDGVTQLFRDQMLNAPHFCIDPGTRRRLQYAPISRASCSLQGGPGGTATNGAMCFQTEICGYANETQNWSDDVLRFIAQHLVDVRRAVQAFWGRTYPLQTTLKWLGPHNAGFVLASPSSPLRLSPAAFAGYEGVLAHQHAPCRDSGGAHYDCGALDAPRIMSFAIELDGGTVVPPPPPTTSEEDELMAAKDDINANTKTEADRVIAAVSSFENDTRRYEGSVAVKVAGNPQQWVIVNAAGGLTRQKISGELKGVLVDVQILQTLPGSVAGDFIEYPADSPKANALLALPEI